ncbi:MAG: hypothetical protein HWN66_03000 [Candidatus Helarchaeota archaeon]|nr:hypothetical protein [Candidatus Helarchaeota archaeon]
MGKVREQAEALGITELPLKTLYARPFLATLRKAFFYPEPAEVVEHYIRYSLGIESFLHDRKGRIGKTREYFYLAPDARLYVEVLNKLVGRDGLKNENHVTKIDIYSSAVEHFRKIANYINELFPGGVLANIVWEKVEKQFSVSREKCIADWKELLIPPETTRKQAEALGLTTQTATVLYAQPVKFEKIFGKFYPNTLWAIRSYVYGVEPALVESVAQAEGMTIYYFLAPKHRLFVQVNYKGPHEIRIYSSQVEHIRGIAKAVDSLFKKGVLATVKWKKIKKEFDIDRDTCIATWKKFLSEDSVHHFVKRILDKDK